MDYRHTARFVPCGETPQSASETKTVTVEASQQCPTEQTASAALEALCGQVTPYAARNHWEVYDFQSAPLNPPWGSVVSVQRKLKSECGEIIEKVQTVRKGRERYVLIHNEEGVMGHHLKQYLQSLYDDQPLGVLIQPRSPTKKCIYFEWETLATEL